MKKKTRTKKVGRGSAFVIGEGKESKILTFKGDGEPIVLDETTIEPILATLKETIGDEPALQLHVPADLLDNEDEAAQIDAPVDDKEDLKEHDEAQLVLTLTVADAIYEGKGETVMEAIAQINPAQMKARGEFVLRSGEKRTPPVYLYPMVIKRLLVNKIAQEIFQKRLLTTLR